jgi:hypothetical protein
MNSSTLAAFVGRTRLVSSDLSLSLIAMWCRVHFGTSNAQAFNAL